MTNFSVWSQRRLFCQKPEPTQFGRSRSPRPGVGSGASDFRSRSRPKKVAAPQQWDPDSQKINADLQPWPGRYGEKYEFILFFKSSWCKIANSARNCINSVPPNSSHDLCLLFCINTSSKLTHIMSSLLVAMIPLWHGKIWETFTMICLGWHHILLFFSHNKNLRDTHMRILYGRVRGSGYNARTESNVSLYAQGAQKA